MGGSWDLLPDLSPSKPELWAAAFSSSAESPVMARKVLFSKKIHRMAFIVSLGAEDRRIMDMLSTVPSGAGRRPFCPYLSCGGSSEGSAFQRDVTSLSASSMLGATQLQPEGQIWALLCRR